MITLEQDKVFRAYEQMFHSDGWKLLMEDLTERRKDIRDAVMAHTSTEKTLAHAKGQDFAFRYLLSLESELKEVEKQLKDLPDEELASR